MVSREERKARFLQALHGEVDLDQMIAWEYEYLDEKKNGIEEDKSKLPEVDWCLASDISDEHLIDMNERMNRAIEVQKPFAAALRDKDWKTCCDLMGMECTRVNIAFMQEVWSANGYTD